MWYANGQVVGCSGNVCADINYLGLMRQLAYDLPRGWHAGVLSFLPGDAEYMGFLLGEGRPHLWLARLYYNQRESVRPDVDVWVQAGWRSWEVAAGLHTFQQPEGCLRSSVIAQANAAASVPSQISQ